MSGIKSFKDGKKCGILFIIFIYKYVHEKEKKETEK
jgi:hypothetical protein